jgi:hypothetical protein
VIDKAEDEERDRNSDSNNAMDRNLHPRHASCVRTCRAGVPVPVMADVRRQTSDQVVNSVESKITMCRLPIVLSLLLAACSPRPKNGARHYTDLVEDDLVAHKVRADIGLSADQKIRWDNCISIKDDPAATVRLRADSASASNAAARCAAIWQFFNSRNMGCINTILSDRQRDRLQELLVQMRGPAIIMIDPEMRETLAITSNQYATMTAAYSNACDHIRPKLQWYGRQQIAGLSRGETMNARMSECDDLRRELVKLLDRRDALLLESLTESQRATFMSLQGKSLHIGWEDHDLGL